MLKYVVWCIIDAALFITISVFVFGSLLLMAYISKNIGDIAALLYYTGS